MLSNNGTSNTTDPVDNGEGLSATQSTIVDSLVIVLALASIVSQLFILSNYTFFPRLRSAISKLVAVMAVGNLVFSLALLVGLPIFENGTQESTTRCVVQGVFVQGGGIQGGIWPAFIAIALYILVTRGKSATRQAVTILIIIGYTIVLIDTAFPIFFTLYGPAGQWCWVNEDLGGNYRMIFYYIQVWIMWIVCIVMYILTSRYYKSLSIEKGGKEYTIKKRALQKFVYYPVMFVVVFIGPSLFRVWTIIEPKPARTRLFLLVMFHHFTLAGMGTLNAIIYGLNESVLREWKHAYGKHSMRSTVIISGIDGTKVHDSTVLETTTKKFMYGSSEEGEEVVASIEEEDEESSVETSDEDSFKPETLDTGDASVDVAVSIDTTFA